MRRTSTIFLVLIALLVPGGAAAAKSDLTLTYVGGHSMMARAGGTWSVLMVVTSSDTGRAVGPEGRIACHATSGTTTLALVSREFTSGGAAGATCTFQVPLRLRNKLLHSTLKVSYGGQSVAHSFSTRVK
jgi:hypothetical protein